MLAIANVGLVAIHLLAFCSSSALAGGQVVPSQFSNVPASYSLENKTFVDGVTCKYDKLVDVPDQKLQAALSDLEEFAANHTDSWSQPDTYTAYTAGNHSSAFILRGGVSSVNGFAWRIYDSPGDCLRSCHDCIAQTIEQRSTHTLCHHHARLNSDCEMEFMYVLPWN